jgi:putative DNA primase/helicase
VNDSFNHKKDRFKTEEASRAIAIELSNMCPKARFCGFTVIGTGKDVKKYPKSKVSGSVKNETPSQYLILADELKSAEPLGDYFGVLMHAPVFDPFNDLVLTCLDVDYKRALGQRHALIDKLVTDCQQLGLLIEKTVSGHGLHIWFLAAQDANLPPKVSVDVGQEIEIFGHPGSPKKSVLLVGNFSGHPIELPSGVTVQSLLAGAGIDLSMKNAQETKKIYTPLQSTPIRPHNQTLSTFATPYATKTMANVLARLRSTPEGGRNNALNRESFVLAQLAAGGQLDWQAARQKLVAVALLLGLDSNEIDATLRSAHKAGFDSPKCPEAFRSGRVGINSTTDPEMRDVLAFVPLESPTIQPDKESFAALVTLIESCTNLNDLLTIIPAQIASSVGIDESLSERLAKSLKQRSKALGFDPPIAQARKKCLTTELLNFEEKVQSVKMYNTAKGRENLRIDGGRLAENAKVVAKKFHNRCFYRGGHVVRICDTPLGKTVTATTKQWLAREASSDFLFWTKNGATDCPARLADVLIFGSEDDFYLSLAGLVRAPFMREDGTICSSKGYDNESGLWVDLNMDMPPIPEAPTKEDATQAVARLLDLVRDFPFASDIARSAWLADLLGAIARPNLPTMPAVLYTAPMPGTGKTLLCSITNMIAYGTKDLNSWPPSEEELSKKLTASLDAGDSYIGFDNVTNGLGVHSAVLSQFLTTSNYQDRRLGYTERVRYRNRMRVVLTGNNISFTHDCARRGLLVELDLNAETPRGRTFAIDDIEGYVSENRAILIADILTILRAHFIAADKPKIKALESFEQWSKTVQSAIVWLGLADPVEAVNFDDSGVGLLGYVFENIQNAMEFSSPFWKASALVQAIEASANNKELKGLFLEAGCSDAISSKTMGHWLKANKNRVAGGFKLLSKLDSNSKTNVWQISRV